MFKTNLLLFALLSISNPQFAAEEVPVAIPASSYFINSSDSVLAAKSISLDNRYDNEFVNDVFKDNILLTLNYLGGQVKEKGDIIWDDVGKPREYQFTLKPGESFSFHEQILPGLDLNVAKTTGAHFNYQDGFKSDGRLTGDGVCHLASLMYWVAKEAGLTAYAPVSHDFAKINEVPRQYGVSIYFLPGSLQKSARENLYITNNFDEDVTFLFSYDGSVLSLVITKSDSQLIY